MNDETHYSLQICTDQHGHRYVNKIDLIDYIQAWSEVDMPQGHKAVGQEFVKLLTKFGQPAYDEITNGVLKSDEGCTAIRFVYHPDAGVFLNIQDLVISTKGLYYSTSNDSNSEVPEEVKQGVAEGFDFLANTLENMA